MNSAVSEFRTWLEYPNHPEAIRTELLQIQGDDVEITERFGRELEFGTGGMRGVLGAGLSRMNVYTIRKASLGLAKFVADQGEQAKRRGVAIGYDCRRMSYEFALETGLVLAASGVKAYVFEHLCPTPELSYAVRHLQAAAGVMITASHNPPEYNGYKVYDSEGCQLLPDAAARLTEHIRSVEDLFRIGVSTQVEAESSGLLEFVGRELDELYFREVLEAVRSSQVTDEQRRALKLVYTPLHGTGNVPVRTVLERAGYSHCLVEPSQEKPDGEFSTVKSPNPEEPAAFERSLQLARQVQADLVLATDPDADRVGVAVRDAQGDYQLLTGNQTGGLLIDFLLEQAVSERRLPANGIVFKTIVTSDLGAAAARARGVAVEDTLTGFKYIGGRIADYEKTQEKQFLFGYEESYGYLISPIVRDKDAVQSCLLIAEMAASYKAQGKNLLDALSNLFSRYGYFKEELVSASLPGEEGMARIQEIMSLLRAEGPRVDALKLAAVEDYTALIRTWQPGSPRAGEVESIVLPSADVLKYVFDGGAWLAIRPSGTEPKIKFYLGARANSSDECEGQLVRLREGVNRILK
ncbi:phospho-sugar mutase [Alicyclobacillus tolerans]|uniref:phospho-sugar mutase n=1 Tax=Alicyclobacillus tolerans TaxID=90970 RepID=UPI001F2D2CFF|nr:phospho-sugar mutase [Alicyclobacillus tolerans]MCF8566406.1 phospho-sugar mutase [Alicyclobacillus tolerans]